MDQPQSPRGRKVRESEGERGGRTVAIPPENRAEANSKRPNSAMGGERLQEFRSKRVSSGVRFMIKDKGGELTHV